MENELYIDIKTRMFGIEEARSAMSELVTEAGKLDPSMQNTRDSIKGMAKDFSELSNDTFLKSFAELPDTMQAAMNGFMHTIASSANTLKQTFTSIGTGFSAAAMDSIKSAAAFLSANIRNALDINSAMRGATSGVDAGTRSGINKAINSMVHMASDIFKGLDSPHLRDSSFASALSANRGFKGGFTNTANIFGLNANQQKNLMHAIIGTAVPTYRRTDYLESVEANSKGLLSTANGYKAPTSFAERLPARYRSLPRVPARADDKAIASAVASLNRKDLGLSLTTAEYNLVKQMVAENEEFERALNMAGVQTRGNFTTGRGSSARHYNIGMPKEPITRDVVARAFGHLLLDIANPALEGSAVKYNKRGNASPFESLQQMYDVDYRKIADKTNTTLSNVVRAFRAGERLGIDPIFARPASEPLIRPGMKVNGRNVGYVGLSNYNRKQILPDQYYIPAVTLDDFRAGRLPSIDDGIQDATGATFDTKDKPIGRSTYKAISRSGFTDLVGLKGHRTFGNESKTDNSRPSMIQLDLSDRFFQTKPDGSLSWGKNGEPERNAATERALLEMVTPNAKIDYTYRGQKGSYQYARTMFGNAPYVITNMKNGLATLIPEDIYITKSKAALEQTGRNVFDAYELQGREYSDTKARSKALDEPNRGLSPSIPLREINPNFKMPSRSQIAIVDFEKLIGQNEWNGSSVWAPGILPADAMSLRGGATDAFKGTGFTMDFQRTMDFFYNKNGSLLLPGASTPDKWIELFNTAGIEGVRNAEGGQEAIDKYFFDMRKVRAMISASMIKRSDFLGDPKNPLSHAQMVDNFLELLNANGGLRGMQTAAGYLSNQNELSASVMQHVMMTPEQAAKNVELWQRRIADLKNNQTAAQLLFTDDTNELHQQVRKDPTIISTNDEARRIVQNAIAAAESSMREGAGFAQGDLTSGVILPNPFPALFYAARKNGLSAKPDVSDLMQLAMLASRGKEEETVGTLIEGFKDGSMSAVRYPSNFAEQLKIFSEGGFGQLIKQFALPRNAIFMNARAARKLGTADFDADTVQLIKGYLGDAIRSTFDYNMNAFGLEWDENGDIKYKGREAKTPEDERAITPQDRVDMIFRQASNAFGLSRIFNAVSSIADENLGDEAIRKRWGPDALALKKMYDVDTVYVKTGIKSNWKDLINQKDLSNAPRPFSTLFHNLVGAIQSGDIKQIPDLSNFNFPSAFHAQTMSVLQEMQKNPLSGSYVNDLIQAQELLQGIKRIDADGQLVDGPLMDTEYGRARAKYLSTSNRLMAQNLTGRGQIMSAQSRNELENELIAWQSAVNEAHSSGQMTKDEYSSEKYAIERQRKRLASLERMGITEERVAKGQGYTNKSFGLVQNLRATDSTDQFIEGLPPAQRSQFMFSVMSAGSPIVSRLYREMASNMMQTPTVAEIASTATSQEQKPIENKPVIKNKPTRVTVELPKANTTESTDFGMFANMSPSEILDYMYTIHNRRNAARIFRNGMDVQSASRDLLNLNYPDRDQFADYTSDDIENIRKANRALLREPIEAKQAMLNWKTAEQDRQEETAASQPRKIAEEISLQNKLSDYEKRLRRTIGQMRGEMSTVIGSDKPANEYEEYREFLNKRHKQEMSNMEGALDKDKNPLNQVAQEALDEFESNIYQVAIGKLKEGISKLDPTKLSEYGKTQEGYKEQAAAIEETVSKYRQAYDAAVEKMSDEEKAKADALLTEMTQAGENAKYRNEQEKNLALERTDIGLAKKEMDIGAEFGIYRDSKEFKSRQAKLNLNALRRDIMDRYGISVSSDDELKTIIDDDARLKEYGLSEQEIRLMRVDESQYDKIQEWQSKNQEAIRNVQRERALEHERRARENLMMSSVRTRGAVARNYSDLLRRRETFESRKTAAEERQQDVKMRIAQLQAKPGDLSKEEAEELNRLQQNSKDMQSSIDADTDAISRLSGAQGGLAVAAGAIGDTFDRLTQMFGRRIFTKLANEITTFVKQYDVAMTDIQMITLKTNDEMNTISDSNIATALGLKTDVTSVAQVKAGLYRQGLNDAEVEDRTEQIIKFAKVAGIKTETASKIITTALQNGLVDSAQEAIDVLAALGDSAATTADEIQKALQKTAATAANTGTSYEELTALLTVAISKTQLSGNVVGTAMSTIMSRMRRVNESDYVKSSTGEITTINDVDRALSRVGVSIRDENGKMKDTVQILKELAGVWESIDSDVTKQNIVYAMAGRGANATNTFYSIMEGLGEEGGSEYAEKLAVAQGATGIVDAKYEKYIDSLNAKVAELRASVQALAESFNASGVSGGFIEIATGAVQAATALGPIPTVITAIVAALAGLATQIAIIKAAKAGTMLGTILSGLGGLVPLLAVLGVVGTGLAIGAGIRGAQANQERAKETQRMNVGWQEERENRKITEAQKSLETLQSINKKYSEEMDDFSSENEKFKNSADYAQFEDALKSLGNAFGVDFVNQVKAAAAQVDGFKEALTMVQNKINEVTKGQTLTHAMNNAILGGTFEDFSKNQRIELVDGVDFTVPYDAWYQDQFYQNIIEKATGQKFNRTLGVFGTSYQLGNGNVVNIPIGSEEEVRSTARLLNYDRAKDVLNILNKAGYGDAETLKTWQQDFNTLMTEELSDSLDADGFNKDIVTRHMWSEYFSDLFSNQLSFAIDSNFGEGATKQAIADFKISDLFKEFVNGEKDISTDYRAIEAWIDDWGKKYNPLVNPEARFEFRNGDTTLFSIPGSSTRAEAYEKIREEYENAQSAIKELDTAQDKYVKSVNDAATKTAAIAVAEEKMNDAYTASKQEDVGHGKAVSAVQNQITQTENRQAELTNELKSKEKELLVLEAQKPSLDAMLTTQANIRANANVQRTNLETQLYQTAIGERDRRISDAIKTGDFNGLGINERAYYGAGRISEISEKLSGLVNDRANFEAAYATESENYNQHRQNVINQLVSDTILNASISYKDKINSMTNGLSDEYKGYVDRNNLFKTISLTQNNGDASLALNSLATLANIFKQGSIDAEGNDLYNRVSDAEAAELQKLVDAEDLVANSNMSGIIAKWGTDQQKWVLDEMIKVATPYQNSIDLLKLPGNYGEQPKDDIRMALFDYLNSGKSKDDYDDLAYTLLGYDDIWDIMMQTVSGGFDEYGFGIPKNFIDQNEALKNTKYVHSEDYNAAKNRLGIYSKQQERVGAINSFIESINDVARNPANWITGKFAPAQEDMNALRAQAIALLPDEIRDIVDDIDLLNSEYNKLVAYYKSEEYGQSISDADIEAFNEDGKRAVQSKRQMGTYKANIDNINSQIAYLQDIMAGIVAEYLGGSTTIPETNELGELAIGENIERLKASPEWMSKISAINLGESSGLEGAQAEYDSSMSQWEAQHAELEKTKQALSEQIANIVEGELNGLQAQLELLDSWTNPVDTETPQDEFDTLTKELDTIKSQQPVSAKELREQYDKFGIKWEEKYDSDLDAAFENYRNELNERIEFLSGLFNGEDGTLSLAALDNFYTQKGEKAFKTFFDTLAPYNRNNKTGGYMGQKGTIYRLANEARNYDDFQQALAIATEERGTNGELTRTASELQEYLNDTTIQTELAKITDIKELRSWAETKLFGGTPEQVLSEIVSKANNMQEYMAIIGRLQTGNFSTEDVNAIQNLNIPDIEEFNPKDNAQIQKAIDYINAMFNGSGIADQLTEFITAALGDTGNYTTWSQTNKEGTFDQYLRQIPNGLAKNAIGIANRLGIQLTGFTNGRFTYNMPNGLNAAQSNLSLVDYDVRTPGQINSAAKTLWDMIQNGDNKTVIDNTVAGMDAATVKQLRNTYGDLVTYLNLDDKGSTFAQNLKRKIEIQFIVNGLDELTEAGEIVDGIDGTIFSSNRITQSKAIQSTLGRIDELNRGNAAYARIMTGSAVSDDWTSFAQAYGIQNIKDYQNGNRNISDFSLIMAARNQQWANTVGQIYNRIEDSSTKEYLKQAFESRGFKLNEETGEFEYKPSAAAEGNILRNYEDAVKYSMEQRAIRNASLDTTDQKSLYSGLLKVTESAMEHNVGYAGFFNALQNPQKAAIQRLIDANELQNFEIANGEYDLEGLYGYFFDKVYGISNEKISRGNPRVDKYISAMLSGDWNTFGQIANENVYGEQIESYLRQIFGNDYDEAKRQLLTNGVIDSNIVERMRRSNDASAIQESLIDSNYIYNDEFMNAYNAFVSSKPGDAQKQIITWQNELEQLQQLNYDIEQLGQGGEFNQSVMQRITSATGVSQYAIMSMLQTAGAENTQNYLKTIAGFDMQGTQDVMGELVAELINAALKNIGSELMFNDLGVNLSSSADEIEAALKEAGVAVDDKLLGLIRLYRNVIDNADIASDQSNTFERQYDLTNERSVQDRDNLLRAYNAVYGINGETISGLMSDTKDWSSFMQSNPALAWAMRQVSQENYSGPITNEMLQGWADRAMFGGSSHEIDEMMLEEMFPGLLEGNLSSDQMKEMFINAQTGDNAEMYNYLMSALPELQNVEKSLGDETINTSDAIRDLNYAVDNNKAMAKYGEESGNVSSAMQNLTKNARTAVKEIGSLHSKINDLAYSNGKLSSAMGKAGKALSDEELDVLSSMTGIDKRQLKTYSEDMISELVKDAQDALDEKWSSEVGNPLGESIMAEIDSALNGDKGIEIQKKVRIAMDAAAADGAVDTSELESVLAAADSSLLSVLNAYAGTGASILLSIFGWGQEAGYKWGGVKSTAGSGGTKTGGGGGGGKSATAKLLEKLKRELAMNEHYIKMVQAQETRYENADELTNYGRMLEIENQAQLDYIDAMQAAIDELKAHMSTLKKDSDDWYSARDAIMGYEEAIESANQAIADNTKKLRENQIAIHKTRTDLEDTVRSEAETREQTRRSMLQGTVNLEETILTALRDRYQDEWDLIAQDIDKKRQALEEEKNLISERLNARKAAEDEASKYEQLAEYQKQLALISMDSTRSKDAMELRKKITDLEKELAWDSAEAEAQAQQDVIDDQIQAYDEFTQIGDERLNSFLEDANNFAAAVDEVLALEYEDLMQWLKSNVDEYKLALDAQQESMLQSWTDTFEQMLNITHLYSDLIKMILLDKDTFIEWMKQSDEYVNATEDMQAQIIAEWEDMWEKYRAATIDNVDWEHSDDFADTGKSSTPTKPKPNPTDSDKKDDESKVDTAAIAQALADSTKAAIDTLKSTVSAVANFGSNVFNSLFGGLKKNDAGGLVNYTGLAWVDGTMQRPESFLDATDTALLRTFLDEARYVKVNMPTLAIDDSMASGSNTVGEVNITINEATISSDEDIDELAKKIGESFTRELTVNGFNTSKYSF